jgi:hypothetical protein
MYCFIGIHCVLPSCAIKFCWLAEQWGKVVGRVPVCKTLYERIELCMVLGN